MHLLMAMMHYIGPSCREPYVEAIYTISGMVSSASCEVAHNYVMVNDKIKIIITHQAAQVRLRGLIKFLPPPLLLLQLNKILMK